MPKLHNVHISKATKHHFCLCCRTPCPPGSRIGGYKGVHVCEMHIEWLRNTPVKPPKTRRKNESNYRPVCRCRMCGKSTGSPDKSMCQDCIDTQKYVPIFAARVPPADKSIVGIISSIKDYEGIDDW